MNDKFILKCPRCQNIGKSVTIDLATLEKLNNLKNETGVAMGPILKQMVGFAMERLELVEE